ncbi:MAG: hypothetical protein WBX38_02850 [Candidatus Sulfotelmatobacter sp.]
MIVAYRFLLAILLAAFAFVLNRAKRSSAGLTPLLGWLMGLGFFLLVPLTIITLRGGYEMPASGGWTEAWTKVNLSNPMFFRPYVVIWLSLMLTCLTAFLSAPPSAQGAAEPVASIPRLERALGITMVLSVIDWVVLVWLVGGFAQFAVSHWYLRNVELAERLGGAFTLYTRLSLANQLLFTGGAALHLGLGLRGRNVRWGFTALIAFFLLVEMAMSGNRIFIAFYLLAFLTSSWLYGRKKLIATLLIASPLLVFLFSAWGAVRHDLSKLPDSVATEIDEADAGGGALSSLMYATEGHGVLLLMHVVNDFGGRFDYLGGSTYARLLTFWLPRSVYPSRPLDFSNQLAILYLPGETTSFCAGALGECYANFGLASVVLFPLFTVLIVRYGAWLESGNRRRPLLSAVSFVVLIWFARCTFAENAMSLGEAAALIWLLKLEVCARPIPASEQTVYS